MCCFSGPVQHVSGTRIFARLLGDQQALIYSMQFSAAGDLAMILPIPTPAGSPEDAVQFVNLEGYKELFHHLHQLFTPPSLSDSPGRGARNGGEPQLKVHDVGAFEASFVPGVKDLGRLDERFRFPAGALATLTRARTQAELGLTAEEWAALPDYRDWGFCVFKLKQGQAQEVHPMAFRFPTRWPDRLFFPAVHVHDGKWTPRAGFDHDLYAQSEQPLAAARVAEWKESQTIASAFVRDDATKGLVEGDQHVLWRRLHGQLANRDVVVELG
jgi:hypothetical protein